MYKSLYNAMLSQLTSIHKVMPLLQFLDAIIIVSLWLNGLCKSNGHHVLDHPRIYDLRSRLAE